MNEILKFLGKMISKISLSFTLSKKEKEEHNKDRGQAINVILNTYQYTITNRIEKIDILSKLDNIYEHETNEMIVQAKFVGGAPAALMEIELCIENVYGPITQRTDNNGMASFHNIRIEDKGNYKFTLKGAGDFIYNHFIFVKENPIKLDFLSQPQDTASKEMLNEIMVQAIYQSGNRAENVQIQIALNREGVSWSGTREKYTDKEGLACFDNLIFTKTGNYKLKVMSGNVFAYSEPFHIFAPGVCIDFEKCESGTQEEIETFLTALLEKQSEGDIITYNGEEY